MIALDDITSPAQTRKPHRLHGYTPEPRPDGGWRLLDKPDVSDDFPADDDHLAGLTHALERIYVIDAEMLVIEKRANVLLGKLADPVLLVEYDAEHSVRLAAEDRLSAYLQTLSKHRIALSHIAYTVQARGRYLTSDQLDNVGMTLSRDSGALGRVVSDCSGIIHLTTWQRLYAASCPF